MVKCTRSTAGSDFSRLRQMRSPACGSPETSSTRSRSRTPLTRRARRGCWPASARPAWAATLELDDVVPPCGKGRAGASARRAARRICRGWPSRRTLSSGAWPLPPCGVVVDAQLDDLLARRPCRSAARHDLERRSNSSGEPVISPCTGASKPSVLAIGGHVVDLAVGDQDRAGDAVGRHVGQRAVEAAKSVVRRRSRSLPSALQPSATSRLGIAGQPLGEFGAKRCVRSARPAMRWLAHSSSTTTAMLESFRAPPASDWGWRAPAEARPAAVRISAPRTPRQNRATRSAPQGAEPRWGTEQAGSAENSMVHGSMPADAEVHFMAPYCPSRSSRAGTWTWSAL